MEPRAPRGEERLFLLNRQKPRFLRDNRGFRAPRCALAQDHPENNDAYHLLRTGQRSADGPDRYSDGLGPRRRDHGGVIFIDMRDREGLVQVVFDPDRADSFKVAEDVRSEFCLKVTGVVRARPAGTENAGLTSGKIEVLGHTLEVLNASVTPPVPDRRREPVGNHPPDSPRAGPASSHAKNLMLRYRVAMECRKYLDEHGFVDIETPMLTKSTPRRPVTIWCPRECTTASSSPCPNRPSCSSSC